MKPTLAIEAGNIAQRFRTLQYGAVLAGLVVNPAVAAVSERPEIGHLSSEGPLTPAYMLQVIVGLLVVLGAILAVAWLVRRSGRFSSLAPGSLRTLGAMSVGARERVVLLQVGKQQILLGVAPGRVQTLHVLDNPIEVEDAAHQSKDGFADILGAALNKPPRS